MLTPRTTDSFTNKRHACVPFLGWMDEPAGDPWIVDGVARCVVLGQISADSARMWLAGSSTDLQRMFDAVVLAPTDPPRAIRELSALGEAEPW